MIWSEGDGPMGRQCEVSGKKTSFGNHVTTRGKKKYLGGVGTKVTGISKRNIPKLKMPVPSRLEQTAIAEVLADMDAELAALEQRRAKTRALKQAMMQELLTGRIRLI